MDKKDFKVGDTCYFIETWTGNPGKGKITRFVNGEKGETYVEIDSGGSTGAKLTDVFHSEKGCADAIRERERIRKEEYKDSIGSVEDLVRFMYTHHVCRCEEYTDWEAREAAREKAEEPLGLTLNLTDN